MRGGRSGRIQGGCVVITVLVHLGPLSHQCHPRGVCGAWRSLHGSCLPSTPASSHFPLEKVLSPTLSPWVCLPGSRHPSAVAPSPPPLLD